jgi:tetratricopeptide (TPR) repeat protein
MEGSNPWPPERWIRFEREVRGWDAEDVACRLVRLSVFLGEPDLDISAAMVTAWETRREPIGPGRLLLLGVVLDLPLETLMPLLDVEPVPIWVILARRAGTIGDDMLRRDFIALIATMSGMPLIDGERLASALGRYTQVDHELLGQLQRTVRMCARQYDQMPAVLLRHRAHGSLDAIKALLAGKLPPSLRRDCMALGAEAAVLAGWASRCNGVLDEARSAYGVADMLARAADDRHVRAFVKVRAADLHSVVQAGGATVDSGEQVRPLLDSAEDLADPSAPPALRAHILLRQAEEHASAGKSREAALYVERADTAFSLGVSRSNDLYGIGWHLGIHDAYRGNVALLSGQPAEAVAVLEGTLSRMDDGTVSNRSSAMADMAAAHAALGNLDHACELLSEAFLIADNAGLEHRSQRVRGIRQRVLEPWAQTRQVRELDELLASA